MWQANVCASLWKWCRFFCEGPPCTSVTSCTMCIGDININSQMSKEKRYILVRDAARIDYFIQRIIPTEDTHALSHVFAEVPSWTGDRYGTWKIASLMDAKPEISEVWDALRYKENDKQNKKIARIHYPFYRRGRGAPVNSIPGSFINRSRLFSNDSFATAAPRIYLFLVRE